MSRPDPRIARIVERLYPDADEAERQRHGRRLRALLPIFDRYQRALCGKDPCTLERVECDCAKRQARAVACSCCGAKAGKTCQCRPVYPFCSHNRLAWDVGLAAGSRFYPWSLDEFLEMAVTHFPAEYLEPPLAWGGEKRITRQQELDLFEARAAITVAGGRARYALRHPDDELIEAADGAAEQGMKGLLRGGVVAAGRPGAAAAKVCDWPLLEGRVARGEGRDIEGRAA